MQYLDALERLHSQSFQQMFIKWVRNFELTRNVALIYEQEQYFEAPSTVEARRFTVHQFLPMCGSSRSEKYPAKPQQHQQPVTAKVPRPLQQPAAYRQQLQRACFDCGDLSHFVVDYILKDRARKPMQQQVNSCNTNPSGGRTCPPLPHGANHDVFPATLPVQGTVAFCNNCGRTGHSASGCLRSRTCDKSNRLERRGTRQRKCGQST